MSRDTKYKIHIATHGCKSGCDRPYPKTRASQGSLSHMLSEECIMNVLRLVRSDHPSCPKGRTLLYDVHMWPGLAEDRRGVVVREEQRRSHYMGLSSVLVCLEYRAASWSDSSSDHMCPWRGIVLCGQGYILEHPYTVSEVTETVLTVDLIEYIFVFSCFGTSPLSDLCYGLKMMYCWCFWVAMGLG